MLGFALFSFSFVVIATYLCVYVFAEQKAGILLFVVHDFLVELSETE